MLNFNNTFETDSILVRPMEIADIDSFGQFVSDKDIWVYFTSDLSNPTDLRQWVEDGVDQIKKESRLSLSIIHKYEGIPVGSTSLGNISYKDKRLEIGWTWLAPEYQGKGINSQVKFLLLKYCFEDLMFKRVEFKTDVLNIAARKALLKIGAVEEGVLRSHTLMTKGRRRDTIYYSILANEWPEIKRKNSIV